MFCSGVAGVEWWRTRRRPIGRTGSPARADHVKAREGSRPRRPQPERPKAQRPGNKRRPHARTRAGKGARRRRARGRPVGEAGRGEPCPQDAREGQHGHHIGERELKMRSVATIQSPARRPNDGGGVKRRARYAGRVLGFFSPRAAALSLFYKERFREWGVPCSLIL